MDLEDECILSEGCLNTVVRMRDRETGARHVVKRYPRADDSERAYSSERAALEILPAHPNVVKYRGCHETSEHRCLVLEHFDGCTLQSLVGSGVLERRMAKRYLMQIILGMEHMHANKVYHCDIKPENILVKQDRLKIIDFGCAIVSESEFVQASCIPLVGTPGFAPPEAVDLTYMGDVRLGDIDVWAFGCCMYYLFTGVVPFVEHFPFDTLRNVRNIQVDLSVLPEDIRSVLSRIFAADPAKRAALADIAKGVAAIED